MGLPRGYDARQARLTARNARTLIEAPRNEIEIDLPDSRAGSWRSAAERHRRAASASRGSRAMLVNPGVSSALASTHRPRALRRPLRHAPAPRLEAFRP